MSGVKPKPMPVKPRHVQADDRRPSAWRHTDNADFGACGRRIRVPGFLVTPQVWHPEVMPGTGSNQEPVGPLDQRTRPLRFPSHLRVVDAQSCRRVTVGRTPVISPHEGSESELGLPAGRLVQPLLNTITGYVLAPTKLPADDVLLPVLAGRRQVEDRALAKRSARRPRSANDALRGVMRFAAGSQGPADHRSHSKRITQANALAHINALLAAGDIQEVACWRKRRRQVGSRRCATATGYQRNAGGVGAV